MEDHRNCQLSRFIEVIVDTDTVVADGAVDVEPDRGQVRQQSAEAVSDESDTPDVIGQTTKGCDGVADVRDGQVLVEFVPQFESASESGLVVAEFLPSSRTPEQVGDQDYVAFLRIPVGHLPHVVVDPEDFLQKYQAGAGALRGLGKIRGESLTGARADIDVSTHWFVSLSVGMPLRGCFSEVGMLGHQAVGPEWKTSGSPGSASYCSISPRKMM